MKRAVLATLLSLASLAATGAEQVRDVSAFKSISVRGPMNLVIEAGKQFSMRVEGEPRYIERLTSHVENGELKLGFKETQSMRFKDATQVTITLPELTAFTAEGAGKTLLRDVRGDSLKVNYRGAGRLEMQGQVRLLNIHAEGVGEVDAHKLHSQDADVNFSGIGSVAIHASNRLDANVDGLGKLTYYGNPRVVNKSVNGIGSVTAANQ